MRNDLISPQTADMMLALRAQKISTRRIALRLGVPKGSVDGWLHRNAPGAPVFAAHHNGEIVCFGETVADCASRAARILNQENPKGEPPWTVADARKTVGPL